MKVIHEHAFLDSTGERWDILGPSFISGYADVIRLSNRRLSVRPLAVLAPAGLSCPRPSSCLPRPSSKEDRNPKNLHEALLTQVVDVA